MRRSRSASGLIGHNGGPPLNEPKRRHEPRHRPEWGSGPIAGYFSWKKAHRDAWKAPSREIALRRLSKAEQLGLTYEEYTLELLERGHYLQSEDEARLADIKLKRRRRAG